MRTFFMYASSMPFLQVPVMFSSVSPSSGFNGVIRVASTSIGISVTRMFEKRKFRNSGIPASPITEAASSDLPVFVFVICRKPCPMPETSQSVALTSSTNAPRPTRLLMKMACDRAWMNLHFSMRTPRTPPLVSLPMPILANPVSESVQLVMSVSSQTRPMSFPSAPRPDFSEMESSPVSNVQPSMMVCLQESTSIPSAPLFTVTFLNVVFSQYTGWMDHMPKFCVVRSSTRTFLQLLNSISAGSRIPLGRSTRPRSVGLPMILPAPTRPMFSASVALMKLLYPLIQWPSQRTCASG